MRPLRMARNFGPEDASNPVEVSSRPESGPAGPGDVPDRAGRPPAVVLNVNDDDANRYVVARTLRRAGLIVREAATGAGALQLAADKPDLVILDVNLPDIDGFEVCRRIKTDPVLAPIPVLHLSAKYVRSEDRVHGLEGGADGYLVQPFEPRELIATVESLLRLRAAEREAEAAARQWQSTFEAIGDGVCLADRDGRVVRCNRALGHLLGMSPEEILGRPFLELLRARTGVPELPPSAPAPGPRPGVELAVGERWFRVRSDPVLDADGAETGAVYTLADVTDRRRAEAAEAEAARNAERILHLEAELKDLERLVDSPTAATGGSAPLSRSSPDLFAEAVTRYGELMEQALEQRRYKVTHNIPEGLRAPRRSAGIATGGPSRRHRGAQRRDAGQASGGRPRPRPGVPRGGEALAAGVDGEPRLVLPQAAAGRRHDGDRASDERRRSAITRVRICSIITHALLRDPW